MKMLEYKVYEVLSRTLPVKEFEQWLYANEYVTGHIADNELVFELVNLDYRSRDIYYQLKVVCKKYLNWEDCLIAIVEFNCRKHLKTDTFETASVLLKNIYRYNDWDSDRELMNWCYFKYFEMDEIDHGLTSKQTLVSEVSEYARKVLEKLDGADRDARIELLKNGLEPKYIEPVKEPTTKKWYQFWK